MEKKKIFNWIVNIILLILVVTFMVEYNKDKDIGTYNFCLEWNYDIYREDLLWKCFDFKTNSKICNWQINNNILYVFDYYNSSDYISYPCTKYAKTIDVEIDLEEPEDIV